MDIMTHHLVPSQAVRTVSVDEALVVIDSRSGQYFGLNEIGARIWCLVQEGTHTRDIISNISTEYDADPETISADIQRILGELVAAGLLN